MNRATIAKVCYALAVLVLLGAAFGLPFGVLTSVPLGLALVAGGLLVA